MLQRWNNNSLLKKLPIKEKMISVLKNFIVEQESGLSLVK
jgi:hypothetical protein